MKVYLQKRFNQKYAGYDAVAMDLITKRKIEALPELIRVARAALAELLWTRNTNQKLIDDLSKVISVIRKSPVEALQKSAEGVSHSDRREAT